MGRDRVASAAPRGFSLIELMFVVAIGGVIAMVAIPAYNKQIQKNHRAVAKARLAQAAQMLERFYSDNSTYYVAKNTGSCAIATNTTGATQDGLMLLINQGWNCSGSNAVYSGSNNESTSPYTLTISTSSANVFTLTATPSGSQLQDTKCLNLTLTNAGVKGVSGSGAVSDCW